MVLLIDIGRYRYTSHRCDSYFSLQKLVEPPDLDDTIKSYDHMLHQSLEKIFRERCHSSTGQIKEFLRGPQLNFIIKPILEQEPILSKHFSKEEFGKLSLLWIAVFCCYQKSVELLVRSGANVNEPFGPHDPQVIAENWTIMQVLIEMGPSPENERLIRLVIEHGADLQARDFQGQTVLHYAVSRGRVELTKMLLESGADVNAADNDGMTPLLVASSQYRPKVQEQLISLLMKHGANVNAANRAGMTPLLLAAEYNIKVLVLLLMEHGADVFVQSRGGENILHLLASTREEEHVDLARVLIEKGVSVEGKRCSTFYQPIHLAAWRRKNEMVQLFLDHGANINALTPCGESPLYMAAELGNVTEVATLLKRGANVHLRTLDGRTALHVACRCIEYTVARDEEFLDDGKTGSTIRLLLSAGADLLAEDHSGNTPFAVISSANRSEKKPGTRLMIEALALRKAAQPSIELKDERIIERQPIFLDHYRKCTEEIDKMKCTRFIESCTFFELFAKSPCQIAELMQNPEFETKFRLYDLNEGFPVYARDIVRAFERAQDHFRSLLEQADVIDEAVHNILPYLVVKKVVRYIFNHCCSE